MFHVEEELKKLPKKPGVYLMHDQADTIIYVGKAINLDSAYAHRWRWRKNFCPLRTEVF